MANINTLSRMKQLMKQMTKHKEEIAKIRDTMRDELSEFEELAEDLDTADGDFDEGVRNFENGLDTISKTL